MALRSASAPSTAVETSNPDSRSPRSSEASTSGSSSTTSTRGEAVPLSMPPSCLIDDPSSGRRVAGTGVVGPDRMREHSLWTQREATRRGASRPVLVLPYTPRLIVEPDDGLQPVREFIESAQNSLLIKQFTFTEDTFIEAVIDAEAPASTSG